ncbi:dihydrofolate reductase family protein [Paenibacillus physcomitrellae]|uniref:Bacterial bifunctional deaminase-reductase C-terminal domain-containing protein n=1 Tax=Paenibacillus physcomitrellae TaxID=1619311 RepID=A0ABQ1G6J6_9BACL|nr:dihydrofolate reductase family protein [Paenibacillus physcomitrellae]GGA37755.1 hypothetical protein GCM10010917_23690 [Paenibacillus physcomitrellae]
MNQQEVVLYVAISLDGYLAREDGSVDWLDQVEGDGGDNGYSEFYRTIGSLVMGRSTYEVVLQLSEEFLYAGKPVYVFTSGAEGITPNEHVVFTDESLEVVTERLKAVSEGDIWLVGGGKLVKGYLEADLIDRVELAVIPEVLGAGIPLFPKGVPGTKFRLTGIRQLGQIAMLSYRTIRENGEDTANR